MLYIFICSQKTFRGIRVVNFHTTCTSQMMFSNKIQYMSIKCMVFDTCTKALKGHFNFQKKMAKVNSYIELCNLFSQISNSFTLIAKTFPKIRQSVLFNSKSIPRFQQLQIERTDCQIRRNEMHSERTNCLIQGSELQSERTNPWE